MWKWILMAVLALFPVVVPAAKQEPALTDSQGPLPISPAPTSASSAPTVEPQPDKDGLYTPGPGVVLPIVIERVAAVFPDADPAARIFGVTQLSLVIDADGHPKDVGVVHSLSESYDRAAIEAVMQSRFAPGTVADRPVPVRVSIRVLFGRGVVPPYPRILNGSQRGFAGALRESDSASRGDYKPPRVLFSAPAEFTDQARAAKYQGTVVLSVLVGEEGLPAQIKFLRHLEMGLDEKAIEAVSQYRFAPATRDGVPVSAEVTIEINFHLY